MTELDYSKIDYGNIVGEHGKIVLRRIHKLLSLEEPGHLYFYRDVEMLTPNKDDIYKIQQEARENLLDTLWNWGHIDDDTFEFYQGIRK